MRFKATDEQVMKMCALAVAASSPVGMGFLHYSPDHTFEPEDFAGSLNPHGAFLDYVSGRMVKLTLFRTDEPGVWEAADMISSDCQSWIFTYPSYGALATAAGAQVSPTEAQTAEGVS
jgi:hypothetical protein